LYFWFSLFIIYFFIVALFSYLINLFIPI
jgi:hypothetical protein